MKNSKNKKENQGFKKSHLVTFLAVFLILLPVFSAVWIFYGPFDSARKVWILTAMSTAEHKYLATAFFSDKTISKYIADYTNTIDEIPDQDVSLINPKNQSNDITVKDVTIGLARGKLMRISNPAKIDVAVCDYIGNSGMTLDNLLRQERASTGINAGAYADQTGSAKGSIPDGIIIKNSDIVFFEESEKEHCLIGFDNNDILKVCYVKTKKETEKLKLRCGVSFGPALIINGEPLIEESGTSLQPRSAIAQCADGSVLFLVLDGRQASSAGATLKNVQDLLLKHGAVTAANLDGGSSTSLIHNGQLLNSPSYKGQLKEIPSAFIVRK